MSGVERGQAGKGDKLSDILPGETDEEGNFDPTQPLPGEVVLDLTEAEVVMLGMLGRLVEKAEALEGGPPRPT